MPPQAVRVLLFQSNSSLTRHQIEIDVSHGGVDVADMGPTSGSAYRGRVLIPFTASAAVDLTTTTAAFIDGLEQRLSLYCTLHVPPAAVASFAAEHHLCMDESPATAIESGACSGDGGRGDRRSSSAGHRGPVSYCGQCCPGLGSPPHGRAPWIQIKSLYRLGVADVEAVDNRAASPKTTAEADEATALPLNVVGGASYAALFQLQMIPQHERARRLERLRGAMPEVAESSVLPWPATPEASNAFRAFAVEAAGRVMRFGLSPPAPLPLPQSSPASWQTSSLDDVVVQRMAAQQRCSIVRLLHRSSSSAVLPCEQAVALFAASLTSFSAELAPATPPPTDEWPSCSTVLHEDSATVADGVSAAAREEMPSSLPPSSAAVELYYENPAVWNFSSRYTAISMSELPSDSELRLTAAEMGVEDEGLHGFSSSSLASELPWIPSNAESRETTPIIHCGDSCPSHFVTPDEGLAVTPAPGDPVMMQVTTVIDEADDEESAEELTPLLPSVMRQSAEAPLTDSLGHLNEAFVYEDEQSGAGVEGFSTERPSPLVWSPPVARDSRTSSRNGSGNGTPFASPAPPPFPLTHASRHAAEHVYAPPSHPLLSDARPNSEAGHDRAAGTAHPAGVPATSASADMQEGRNTTESPAVLGTSAVGQLPMACTPPYGRTPPSPLPLPLLLPPPVVFRESEERAVPLPSALVADGEAGVEKQTSLIEMQPSHYSSDAVEHAEAADTAVEEEMRRKAPRTESAPLAKITHDLHSEAAESRSTSYGTTLSHSSSSATSSAASSTASGSSQVPNEAAFRTTQPLQPQRALIVFDPEELQTCRAAGPYSFEESVLQPSSSAACSTSSASLDSERGELHHVAVLDPLDSLTASYPKEPWVDDEISGTVGSTSSLLMPEMDAYAEQQFTGRLPQDENEMELKK